MTEKIISALSDIPNLIISENELMSKHTTFKIGGPAKLFIDAQTRDAAAEALTILFNLGISPYILGNGSNTLFPDTAYDTPVLKLSCNNITMSGEKLSADAGVLLPVLSSFAMKNSLTGLEFAQGIPGTVGGALVMNSGAYGGEISNTLVSSTYFHNGKFGTLKAFEHEFAYRDSFYKKHTDYIILSAEFKLSKGNQDEISEMMRDFGARRRDKQPLELPNAGSVFKRPAGYFAGALIEQCGLKGFSVGGACVSQKHAGFIVNNGGATADDVKRLINHIQETVLKETGVSLECEICIL